MAYLYTHNGKLLKVGNKLASSTDCCCRECCTPTAPTLIFRSPDYPEDPETTYTQYWCGPCCQGLTFAFTYPGGGFSITIPWGATEAGYTWVEGLSASGDVQITVSYACVGNQLKLSISYHVYPTGNTHTYEAVVPVSTTSPCCPTNGALTLTQTSTPVAGESLNSVTIGAAGTGLFHDDGGGHVDAAELLCGDACLIGACCVDGTCTTETEADCTTLGGVFHPDVPCESEFCWWACCANETTPNEFGTGNIACTNQPNQSACESQDTEGGNITYIWQEGWKCEISGVGPCLGLCCFDGDCYNYTEAQCVAQDGYWTPESFGTMCLGDPNGVPCLCVDDSECPDGTCCVPYEPGDPDSYGQCAPCSPPSCPEGYHVDGGDCVPDTGACCIYADPSWSCSVTELIECRNAGGVWQGAGVTCEDGSCEDTCCVTVTDDTCTVTRCEAGYFSGHPACVGNVGCDDTAPRGNTATGSTTAVIYCKEGTELETTATFSGAVFNTGDAGYDTFLSGLMNTGYSVTRTGCTGDAGGISGTLYSAVGSYDVYGEGPLSHDVRVIFPTYASKTTRISIILGGSTIYFMEFAATRSRPVGPCDDPYDCADRFTAHGPPTSKGGVFDCPTCFVVTGATVTCS